MFGSCGLHKLTPWPGRKKARKKRALFGDITQHMAVILTDISGQLIGPIFKGKEYSCSLNIEQIGSKLR